MKRFSFPLERVLEFRRQLEEVEQGLLLSLGARHERLLEQAGQMAEQARLCRHQPASQTTLSALDLCSAYNYAQALGRAKEKTLAEAERIAGQRRIQMTRVLEARRQVKLLEILRSRQVRGHARLADRELETLASELHLAKLSRERPPRLPAGGPPVTQAKKF